MSQRTEESNGQVWQFETRGRLAEIMFPAPEFVREEYVSLDSYQERRKRQVAWFRWALDLGVEYKRGADQVLPAH